MSLGERSDHTAIRYLQVAAGHLSVPNQSRREQDLARHHGKVIRARNRTDSRIGLCHNVVHARRYGRVLFEFQSAAR